MIGSSVVSDSFVGFRYSLVAKVISRQEVHRDNFIKTFTSLWRGSDEVSIKEIAFNRFWVRFVSDRDYQRVLDMEPWTFRRSLILLATVSEKDCIYTVPLTHGTFWVQIHGVPGFCMTVAVATTIATMIGEVIWVDNRDGQDCVGRFIRVRVRFDVSLPLMRRSPVTFPEVGEKFVEFRYEYLPEYCFACGCLGHATQECVKKHEASRGKLNPKELSHFTYAFEGLEGVVNLRGKPIGASARRLSLQMHGSSHTGEKNIGDGSGGKSWRNSDEATDTDSSLYKQRHRREVPPSSPGLANMARGRTADVSTHSGTVSMDDGVASLSLAKEVIQAVTPTPLPVMENGISDTNKEIVVEEGSQEDMATVLLDPVRRVQLPVASDGEETIAFIAQNSDPFNFMPIIERTAGKVKGRGRGRSRRVGVVSASPSAQGVSVSSIKRKRPTDHHDIGDCEQAQSVVPGKRRLCVNDPTEQAKEASLEGPPRSQC